MLSIFKCHFSLFQVFLATAIVGVTGFSTAHAAAPNFSSYSITVQNGQTQRSFVRYLDLSFNTGNSLSTLLTDNRIKMTRFDLNGVNGVNVPLPMTTVTSNHIILNFGAQGIGGNANSNIGDGYYEIAVDMDGNGSFESTKYFYRLLGDISGDRKVSAADKTQVLVAQGGTYNPESDANGDGVINVLDTTLVTRAMNRTLKNGLPLTENGLTITQKATTSSDTAVANQKNISLIRFEARAENEEILTTSFAFAAAQGSLLNGSNYVLWVDTDGNSVVDTVLQNGVAPSNGVVTFNALAGGGYVVSSTNSVIFEVHTDIASSLTSTSLQLKFATTVPAYVSAERLSNGTVLFGIKTDGTCAATCATTVTTTTATIWTLRSQGDLFITKSSTPTRSRMALGGTLSDEVLRLQFHAEYEDIDVTNLVLTATGPNAGSFAMNVDRIELFKVGATTPFATATVGGCGSDPVPANSMCARMNFQELVIPKGSNTNILVRLLMRTDIDGSVSGQQVKLTVDAVAGAKARGLISSNDLSQNDGDGVPEGELLIGVASPAPSQTIVGNDHVVVHSKVTSITNADPNANGTAIPTGSQRAIGQFKFAAAAASNLKNGQNKWTLSDIIFNVNATNVLLGSGDQTSLATSDFKIYNKADPTVKSTCTANKASASGSSLVVTCSNIMSSSVNTEIDPGTDTTFVLDAEVANGKISNSSTSTLQVSLQNFGDIAASGFGTSQSHVRWLDKDNGASTSFLWIEYPETTINGTSYQG